MRLNRRYIVAAVGVGAGLTAAGIIGGPFSPLPPGMSGSAAILAAVVILWLFEAFPLWITGLAGVAALAALNAADIPLIVSSFTDQVILLFTGSFLLARAVQKHDLDKQIAGRLLAHPVMHRQPGRIMLAVGLTAALLAMWMNITTAVIILFTVALAAVSAHPQKDGALAAPFLLFLVYAASAGALATPVGTPPNLIGLAMIRDRLNVDIGFLHWMAVGIPAAAALLITRWLLVRFLYRSAFHGAAAAPAASSAPAPGPLTGAQITVLAVFGAAIVLWMGRWLPEGAVALIAAGVLFILRPSGDFLLTPSDGRQIDWGTIVLFGSGIVFGKTLTATGIAGQIGAGLGAFEVLTGFPLFLLAVIAAAALLSELTSNTASANIILPIVLSIPMPSISDSIVLALAATWGCGMGFMLPVSTPGNAIVYGSGRVGMGEMMRTGLWIDLAGVLLLWALFMAGLPWLGGFLNTPLN